MSSQLHDPTTLPSIPFGLKQLRKITRSSVQPLAIWIRTEYLPNANQLRSHKANLVGSELAVNN